MTGGPTGEEATARIADLAIAAAARTHSGRVRRGNEDCYLAQPPLFAVADGLGGLAAGEVASRIAIDVLAGRETAAPSAKELAELLRSASRLIRRAADADLRLAGMGTTCTALVVTPDRADIAHVGDTRAYVLRGGELSLLTRDHSLAQELVRVGRLTADEATGHVSRNTLTRALGAQAEPEVDVYSWPLRAGDRLLLASDGLTGMVDDDRICGLLTEGDAARSAEALVAAALDAGGLDNVTVIVVNISFAQDGE